MIIQVVSTSLLLNMDVKLSFEQEPTFNKCKGNSLYSNTREKVPSCHIVFIQPFQFTQELPYTKLLTVGNRYVAIFSIYDTFGDHDFPRGELSPEKWPDHTGGECEMGRVPLDQTIRQGPFILLMPDGILL